MPPERGVRGEILNTFRVLSEQREDAGTKGCANQDIRVEDNHSQCLRLLLARRRVLKSPRSSSSVVPCSSDQRLHFFTGQAQRFEVKLTGFWLRRNIDSYGCAMSSDGNRSLRLQIVREVLPKLSNSHFDV